MSVEKKELEDAVEQIEVVLEESDASESNGATEADSGNR